MKVLHVNKLYSLIGGVENHLYYLTHDLSKRCDVKVKVLACNRTFRNERIANNSLEVFKLASTPKIFRMPIAPAFPFRLRELEEVDIIHFHHPFPLGEVSYLLSKPSAKLVVTWHSDIVSQKNALRIYRPVLLVFLRRVDVILATSPNYVQSSPFLSTFRDKCQVVPLGIDVNKFKRMPQMDAEVQTIRSLYGSKIVLYIGKLRYYKGLEYLIQAMKSIEARLIIVGEGPLKGKLQKLATHLNLLKKVTFVPHVSDKRLIAFYHACDVFALPSVSRSEAFGIVQLEAMACGKPVVSTNLPTGVPFVNQHEKTGLVVPPKDTESLSKAINLLFANPDLRRRFGDTGKERVKKKFTRELVADSVMHVYSQLLAPARTSPASFVH